LHPSIRLDENTPVIVFRGTGGAADVLANSLEFLAVKANEWSNRDATDEHVYKSMTTLEMMEILHESSVDNYDEISQRY